MVIGISFSTDLILGCLEFYVLSFATQQQTWKIDDDSIFPIKVWRHCFNYQTGEYGCIARHGGTAQKLRVSTQVSMQASVWPMLRFIITWQYKCTVHGDCYFVVKRVYSLAELEKAEERGRHVLPYSLTPPQKALSRMKRTVYDLIRAISLPSLISYKIKWFQPPLGGGVQGDLTTPLSNWGQIIFCQIPLYPCRDWYSLGPRPFFLQLNAGSKKRAWYLLHGW